MEFTFNMPNMCLGFFTYDVVVITVIYNCLIVLSIESELRSLNKTFVYFFITYIKRNMTTVWNYKLIFKSKLTMWYVTLNCSRVWLNICGKNHSNFTVSTF